jgi:hypothetical protein
MILNQALEVEPRARRPPIRLCGGTPRNFRHPWPRLRGRPALLYPPEALASLSLPLLHRVDFDPSALAFRRRHRQFPEGEPPIQSGPGCLPHLFQPHHYLGILFCAIMSVLVFHGCTGRIRFTKDFARRLQGSATPKYASECNPGISPCF